MTILNPCEQLNNLLESKVSFLENAASIAGIQVTDVVNNIEGYSDVVTSVEDVTNATNDATASAIGIDDAAVSDISTFSGSCLENILNGMDSIQNDILNTVNDAMDAIPSMFALPELPISQLLQALESLIDVMNINSIIDEIDRILGCLSDAVDLPDCQTEIVDAGTRVDAVIDALRLTDTGLFDFDTFTTGLSTSASFIANLKSIGEKTTDLSTEAVETISSIKPTVKVPENFW